MKQIFIDCGFHHGEGLKYFIDHLGIGPAWDVHCFEPNPECHIMERLKELADHKTVCDRQVFPHNDAVWVSRGVIEFSQENWEISKSGSPKNPCVLDGWASCITDLKKAWPGLMPPIKVSSIDFSDFLLNLRVRYFGKCEIYCKMDIEGAEFPVLRRLIETGTIKYIKKLWVEFHERYIPGESRQTKAELIRHLSLYTEVEQWH
jgi:FkbM family methyltransferase